MLRIEIDNKAYQVPGKLSEYPKKVFLKVLPFLFEENQVAMRSGLAVAILPKGIRSRFDEMSDEQIAGLFESLTRFVDTPEKECPLKNFRIWVTRYHLPRYERLSTIEAAKAQEFLQTWQRTKEAKYLDLVIATLCRPKRFWLVWFPFLKRFFPEWDGDIREKYNAEIVAGRVKRFSKLPMVLKMAVLWHFSQMMIVAKKQFPSVFKVAPESKPGPLIDMVFHLSGSELGDYRSVSHTPLLTVLYLIHKRLEAQS